MARPLSVIAREIREDWAGKISPHAKPYLDAMATMNDVNQSFGFYTGKSAVLYFLSNASSWRGAKAREVKKELRKLVE